MGKYTVFIGFTKYSKPDFTPHDVVFFCFVKSIENQFNKDETLVLKKLNVNK
jgi:hypothetical protein